MGKKSIKENKNRYHLAREELGLTREEAADLLSTTIGVGEENNSVLTYSAEERLLFLIVEDGKAAGGNDFRIEITHKRAFVVSSLNDYGQIYFNFFHFLFLFSNRGRRGDNSGTWDFWRCRSLCRKALFCDRNHFPP